MRFLQNLLISFLAVVVALIFAELFSNVHFLIKPENIFAVADRQLYSINRDQNLGYKLKKNDVFYSEKKLNTGEICYSVEYKTDQFGRRVTGLPLVKERRSLLIFGNSFAFGEGLNNHDTLPYLLGKQLPEYNIFNYAVHGYGPNQALALLETKKISNEIDNSYATAILIVVPDDIFRATGSARTPWVYDSPYYYLNEENRLIREGSFRSGRPYITVLYKTYSFLKKQFKILKLLNIELMSTVNSQDVQFFARLLTDISKLYSQQLGGKLHVVFYPSWDSANDPVYYDELSHLLKKNEVSYFDLSDYRYSERDMILPECDKHPNGTFNKLFAEKIVNELNLAN